MSPGDVIVFNSYAIQCELIVSILQISEDRVCFSNRIHVQRFAVGLFLSVALLEIYPTATPSDGAAMQLDGVVTT